MNQTSILKALLADYQANGGDLHNVILATAYINAYKPAGIGRVSPVICAAVLKRMGEATTAPPTKTMTTDIPAIVEPAPEAAKVTISIPEIVTEAPLTIFEAPSPAPFVPTPTPISKPEKPVAIFEAPKPTPVTSSPVPKPEKPVSAVADISLPPPQARIPAKPSLWSRLKFWKKPKI